VSLIQAKTKVDDQVWRRVVQKLYPQGNPEITDKLESILNQRRFNLSQEYTKTHFQRKLSRDQIQTYQKKIKEEARLYYTEVQAVVQDYQIKSQEMYLARLNGIFAQQD
jgi:hypothetical protein